MSKNQKVVVVGQGYVGLPLAILASSRYKVVGFDTALAKIEALNSGVSESPDVSPFELGAALRTGQYRATSEIDEIFDFDICVITVPTPLRGDEPDLSHVEEAAQAIGPRIKNGSTVILESTSYPGTTDELVLPILEKTSGKKCGSDFFLGYSPERIDPGNKQWSLQNVPKIVSGVDVESFRRVRNFYRNIGVTTVDSTGTREAEMAKLLENTFRHLNIALVNDLLRLSKHVRTNIWEAVDLASTKPFGFMRFTPGPGVGGHCLPVDPSYLSWALEQQTGEKFRLVATANSINDSMPSFVVSRLKELLAERPAGEKSEPVKLLLVGLAYKAGTGDVRDSPGLAVAALLREDFNVVYGFDSLVPSRLWPDGVVAVDAGSKVAFDVGIVLTHQPPSVMEWVSGACGLVLDTQNSLSGDNVVLL